MQKIKRILLVLLFLVTVLTVGSRYRIRERYLTFTTTY
jgi:hypothetical protein